MKTTLALLFIALSAAAVCGEDKAKAEVPENVICKKCNCDARRKIIECSNSNLTAMFSVDDWAVLNATKDEYEILKLDNNQLESIDVPFPTLRFPLKVINFRHNKIKKIVKKVFFNLDFIEEIDLSFNELTTETLIPEIFEGKYSALEYEPMQKLKRLSLSYNLLHNLDDMIFEHTKHLQELYLDNNPFHIIHPNVMKAFSDVTQLQLLDLSRTEISSLPEAIFHPLQAIKVLKLQGNLFKTIPEALRFAKNLRELSLDENPIGDLSAERPMPPLGMLQKLNMTFMPSLTVIGKDAMSGLANLTELRLCHNHHLEFIHPDAFTYRSKDNPEILLWPHLKKLHLENNNLTTLDPETFDHWEHMEEIHLHDNPWLCDCELQWVSNMLMPIVNRTTPHLIDHVKCAEPHAMVDKKLMDLSEDKTGLRCLDKYGAHPERDSALLVALLIGVLLGMPLAFAFIMLYKRGCGRRGPADFSRAFYKRADMQDDVHI